MAGFDTGDVFVLKGDGQGNLLPAFQPSVGASAGPAALVAGHFANGALPDIAVADNTSAAVSILVNQFPNPLVDIQTAVPAITVPQALAAGDFNGDGNLDLAVVNSDSNTIAIMLGDGKGDLTLAQSLPVGSEPSGIVWPAISMAMETWI